VAVVSAAAGVTGELVVRVVRGLAGPTRTGSLVVLLVGTVVIGAAALAGTLVARVPEVREPLAAARARLGRG
jgi:putative peptidoglycan lipid II flippase